MTRGVKIRLLAFVVLSAVGVTWVAGNYLGIIDRILGRGITVHATLPDSGGLFVGSEVTIRGVKVGKVDAMQVESEGLKLDLALREGTKLPIGSPMFVHNLSAVGEQYLDFEPTTDAGPYAEDGTVMRGSEDSMPTTEQAILTNLDGLVDSLDGAKLSSLIDELGTMFDGTAQPLEELIDSGMTFVEAAKENEAETIALFTDGQRFLQTQADNAENIQSISKDLANFTEALAASDGDFTKLLKGGPGTAREVTDLMNRLGPVLPVFLTNLIGVNEVVTGNLGAIEQLLRTFPVAEAGSPTATPGDGYGHVNLQLSQNPPPCTGADKGYFPEDKWRPASDTSDPKEPFLAKCTDPNLLQRGVNYAPPGGLNSSGSDYRPPAISQKKDKGANKAPTVTVDQSGRHSVFGDNTWQWMLAGPVASEQ